MNTSDILPEGSMAIKDILLTLTSYPEPTPISVVDRAVSFASTRTYRSDVTLDRVDAAGRSIGDVLAREVVSCNADLLVMGAYGHSRLREFILGGATRNILSKPLLPILLSH